MSAVTGPRSGTRREDWPAAHGGAETAAEALSSVALSENPGQVAQASGRRVGQATRETVEQKAGRVLVEGRLTVHEVTVRVIRVTCVGSTGEAYHVGWARGRWGCSCQAGKFRRVCAHLLALQRVTFDPSEGAESAGRRTA